MNKVHLLASILCLSLIPSLTSAALVAALDFTGGGSAWTLTTHDGGAPLTYELGGDPTNVGIATTTSASGHYNLSQQVFAPVGYTMSNVRVEALGSGYSSWVIFGRLGLDLTPQTHAPASDYWISAGDTPTSGTVNVNVPMVLDSTANVAYDDITSVYVMVDVVKGLAGVWVDNNVKEVKVYADLTLIPEPSSIALFGAGGLALLRRRRA